jgi:glutamyl-tRNA synthetase
MVRTRIAPSPTGFPHIGTIYQALFNYAFAHRNKGVFLVRIEDTDRQRLVEGAEDKIFEAIDWFSLTENESPRKGGNFGPYRQSERLEIYHKYAEELIDKGRAYYCFCTKERLEALRASQAASKQPIMYDRQCRSLDL